MRTHRSAARPGSSGRTSSPSARSVAIVDAEGTLPESENDAWMPAAASLAAVRGTSCAGMRTISPTSGRSVLTCSSGCTCRILLATAVTSSVDIIQVPAPSSRNSCEATAAACSRQRGMGRTRRGAPRTTSAACGCGAGRDPARRLVREAHQVKRSHRARIHARVAHGQPIGDDRGAGRHRLQACHTAGRVDQHVGGSQQLGHLVGEPVDVHLRHVVEGPAQLVRELIVAGRQADDARHLGHRHELPYRAADITHPPAAAGHDDHAAVLGEPQRAPCGKRTARLQELRCDQRPHEPHAALSGDALHGGQRLAVGDDVHVDPGLGPEEEPRQVGDGGNRGAPHGTSAPQAREHDRNGRVGGHDDVGVVFGDAASERARAEQAQQPAREHAHRHDVVQQPVDDRVAPGHESELDAIAVLHHRA